jgi:UDP-3-O-acyl-N-acetylglucosamine deacetylase
MGNIKFEIFPVYPLQFAMLEIESKKKEKVLVKGASQGRAFCFYSEIEHSRETGYGHDQEEG